MVKHIITLIIIFGLVMMPSTYAFSLFGIDFGKVWDKITFWDNDDKVTSTTTPTNTIHSNSNGANHPNTPTAEIFITLAGTKYTQSSLKSTFSSNEELQGYVKGFNYECVFVETDKGEKFTLNFNTDSGTLKSLKKGNSCEDKEIYLEESLISDIQENGFEAKSIKSYLEKVDLPWSMYAKALKVFTIG